MLGKLLKYEWKGTAMLLLPLNIGILVMTVIGRLMLELDVFNIDHPLIEMINILLVTFYIIGIVAISIISYIFLIMRFYKTVYTDEGYLLHTLPVNQHEIIGAKVIVAVFWTLLNGIVIAGSVFFLLSSQLSGYELRMMFSSLIEALTRETDMSGYFWIVYFVITCVVGSFYSILLVYGCISLGQLFGTHKVLGAFVSYAGVYVVLQILSSVWLVINDSMNQMFYDMGGYINDTMIFGLIMSILGTGVFYFITWFMMKRKLNLE